MNTKQEIDDISKRLNELISLESIRRVSANTAFRDKFEMMVFDLNRLMEDSESLLADYKEQGLAFNTIEAEGYHRAMLTVKSIIDEYSN